MTYRVAPLLKIVKKVRLKFTLLYKVMASNDFISNQTDQFLCTLKP